MGRKWRQKPKNNPPKPKPEPPAWQLELGLGVAIIFGTVAMVNQMSLFSLTGGSVALLLTTVLAFDGTRKWAGIRWARCVPLLLLIVLAIMWTPYLSAPKISDLKIRVNDVELAESPRPPTPIPDIGGNNLQITIHNGSSKAIPTSDIRISVFARGCKTEGISWGPAEAAFRKSRVMGLTIKADGMKSADKGINMNKDQIMPDVRIKCWGEVPRVVNIEVDVIDMGRVAYSGLWSAGPGSGTLGNRALTKL